VIQVVESSVGFRVREPRKADDEPGKSRIALLFKTFGLFTAQCMLVSAISGCGTLPFVSQLDAFPPNLRFVLDNPVEFDTSMEENLAKSRDVLTGCWARVDYFPLSERTNGSLTLAEVILIDVENSMLRREHFTSLQLPISRTTVTVDSGPLETSIDNNFTWTVTSLEYSLVGEELTLIPDPVGLASQVANVGRVSEFEFQPSIGRPTVSVTSPGLFFLRRDGQASTWIPFDCSDSSEP
jgi:hypothetical protein